MDSTIVLKIVSENYHNEAQKCEFLLWKYHKDVCCCFQSSSVYFFILMKKDNVSSNDLIIFSIVWRFKKLIYDFIDACNIYTGESQLSKPLLTKLQLPHTSQTCNNSDQKNQSYKFWRHCFHLNIMLPLPQYFWSRSISLI